MVKRWNKVFVHDKVMPEWIYQIINLVMCVLDLYYWSVLLCARIKRNSGGAKYYFSICAIFKDESLSIKEWIEYHKLIGVEHSGVYRWYFVLWNLWGWFICIQSCGKQL